jgi:predicted tellurium resistance membrane protein TerC
MSALLSVDALLGLATLTIMEIVLGIDNVVFIAILVAKLPTAQQGLARRLGLTLALGIRILLLLTISWIGAHTSLWTLGGPSCRGVTSSAGGGLFLMVRN